MNRREPARSARHGSRAPLALALALLLMRGGFGAQAPPPAPGGVAVTGVTVIDVETGSRLSERTVLVAGQRITAVGGAQLPVPATARVVDGRGRFLIPGLWDMHVHALPGPGRARALETVLPLFVVNGVTGVRDMGADLGALESTRGLLARSTTAVPRVVAGALFDGPTPTSVPLAVAIADDGEARRAMDAVRMTGADFVSVYSALARPVYFSIIALAREHAVSVAGHVPFSVSAGEASDAGQRSIEHLDEISMGCSPDDAGLRRDLTAAVGSSGTNPESLPAARRATRAAAAKSFDAARCRDLFVRFKKNGTWVVPALAAAYSVNDPARAADDRARYVAAETAARWKAALAGPGAEGGAQTPTAALESVGALRTVRDLAAAGVGLLAGTDTGHGFTLPGFDLHLELSLLAAAGLPPLHALQAATINPARFLSASAVRGTVAAGKFADLVLLDANPLLDIRNTTKIHAVVANGRLYTRADLDAALAAVETAVKARD